MVRGRRENGEGTLFQDATGFWVARVSLGYRNGKRIQKTVKSKSKAEALHKLRLLQAQIAEGIDLRDSPTVESWCRYWMEWIAVERCRPGTLTNYRYTLEKHIYPTLGQVRLRDVQPQDLRRLYVGVSGGATRLKIHRILARAFKVAEREGKLSRNPCDLMDSPSAESVPHEVLSAAEARLVLDAAESSRDSARLVLALVLGLRQSEVLALDWQDVDFDKQTLSVNKSVQTVPGVGVVFSKPKSRASGRVIPLPQAVVDVMGVWKAEGSGVGLVFPAVSGTVESRRVDLQRWRRALTRAGVRQVPLHGARGTAASVLLELGVPDKWIADILGHANPMVTQQHYLHSDVEQRLKSLEGLTDALNLRPETTTS